MPTIATYGTSDFAMMPQGVLPEPGDDITHGWFDALGLFSQRYLKMATTQQVIADGGTYTFDYSTLRNDYFPPYLQAYYWKNSVEGWTIYNPACINGTWGTNISTIPYLPGTTTTYTRIQTEYIQFFDIGLGTCKFLNKTGSTGTFLLMGYM